MEFSVTAGSVWNSIAINNVLVPVDGDVEIRLYQLICNGGTPNRYVVRYDDLSLKIEKTSGLSLAKLGVKAVTGSPYANVHPDYNTFIGDAITSNSASAIRLINLDNVVSEDTKRPGEPPNVLKTVLFPEPGGPHTIVTGVIGAALSVVTSARFRPCRPSWQSLHRARRLLSSSRCSGASEIGRRWCTSVAALVIPRPAQSSHSGWRLMYRRRVAVHALSYPLLAGVPRQLLRSARLALA
jgi:hypothetical protein